MRSLTVAHQVHTASNGPPKRPPNETYRAPHNPLRLMLSLRKAARLEQLLHRLHVLFNKLSPVGGCL